MRRVPVEPLFNTYKPVTDTKIRDSILAMAQANEIPVKQVFEVDASRQTTRVSANVSGFLGTTRIALNDNLLSQCTLPEIRAVMAHEMGHYVLNHGAKLLTYLGIFILVGFAWQWIGKRQIYRLENEQPLKRAHRRLELHRAQPLGWLVLARLSE